MQQPYDYFVIFANMRTGSNFLEENVNDYPGLKCWGEAFNPHFVGHAGKTEAAGVTLDQREADPVCLLDAMRAQTEGLAGFRFFPGHDPRIMERALKDKRCAKVILTRNPVESYVSHKIAAATGQWRLGDLKNAKSAKVVFDKVDFERMLGELQAFQMQLQGVLQRTGQSAFYIGYDDIQDIEVLNGLAKFLGCDHAKDKTNTKTKVQNPGALRDKVENYDDMVAALANVDHFNLGRTPNFEPRRGPAVPRYVAAATAPLLYMPIKGGHEDEIKAWMAALGPGELLTGFTQKTLRQWKRKNDGHRAFTVVRHPVARLHAVFCRYILSTGPESYTEIRNTLRGPYKLPLPKDGPGTDWTVDAHRAAFVAFADWVKGNLGGQTSVRVDGAWASQSEFLAGISGFAQPDMVIRAEDMAADLAHLARKVGLDDATAAPAIAADQPFALAEIYDDTVETAVKGAYQRDYMMFGYGAWRS